MVRNDTNVDETTFDFKKSSFCATCNCVEVANLADDDGVVVRDSKNTEQAPLQFTNDEWKAFVQGVKAGEFDS